MAVVLSEPATLTDDEIESRYMQTGNVSAAEASTDYGMDDPLPPLSPMERVFLVAIYAMSVIGVLSMISIAWRIW